MFGRIGVLEALVLPVMMMAMIGPTRFGLMASYAAGLAVGGQQG